MFNLSIGKGSIILDKIGCIQNLFLNETDNADISDTKSHFIVVGYKGRILCPKKLTGYKNILFFNFDFDINVKIEFTENEDYTTFEVLEINDKCDCIAFGPYQNTINKNVGYIVGVVSDDNNAFGVQALNIKTMPGFPEWHKNYIEKLIDININSNISVGDNKFSSVAAMDTANGSALQLYCENKSLDRLRTINNVENVPVTALHNGDENIVGAKFAMFACASKNALPVIGNIEIAEGLPHPLINGEWAKTSRLSMKSYLVTMFSESNIDKFIDITKKCGFDRLYHLEPFSKWGHFELDSRYFPNGDDSLVNCSKKASASGIGIGLHTLSNFTSTNDGYVSPVPDERLMKYGAACLSCDILEEYTDIEVDSIELFNNVSSMQCVKIEKELIKFSDTQIRDGKRFLTDCERGAFNTKAVAHISGKSVEYLIDHDYKVFFPNVDLQDEYIDRLIELYNKANIVSTSFDGLECCRYEGEGEYGISRLCLNLYNGLNHSMINDASQLTHNAWHMNTYMNWGEPWRDKVRVDMTEYRIGNQNYYRNNLLPRMFGWFLIRNADKKYEATTLDDIEWVMSETSGYDAGFAYTIYEKAADSIGNLDTLLATIKNWEELRMSNSFSDEIKLRLQDTKSEWHLERIGEKDFSLYQMFISPTFTCDLTVLQPGQPGGADWIANNPYAEQNYECKIHVTGEGDIENLMLTTKSSKVKFCGKINNGEYLFYKFKDKAEITDKNYNVLREIPVKGEAKISSGQQGLSMSCDFDKNEEPEVNVIIYTYDTPINITKKIIV